MINQKYNLNDKYLLFDRIIQVDAFAFIYHNPETGEETDWKGGLMLECIVFDKTFGKLDDKRKLEIDHSVYDKIQKMDDAIRIDYLAELNTRELKKINLDLNFWENNETISKDSLELINQKRFLESVAIQFVSWFKTNNKIIPRIELSQKSSTQKKFIWNRSEQQLRYFIDSCIDNKFINPSNEKNSILANFLDSSFSEFVKDKPVKIKWLKSNTDLIYLIDHLISRNILLNSLDKWSTTSHVFFNKNSNKLSASNLAVQADQVKNQEKPRNSIDSIINRIKA